MVISQPWKVNQGFVASKSRFQKRDNTIPRLQFTATIYRKRSNYKYQSSSKRFKIEISGKMDRQYCCFTLVEESGKFQSICREQS